MLIGVSHVTYQRICRSCRYNGKIRLLSAIFDCSQASGGGCELLNDHKTNELLQEEIDINVSSGDIF